MRTIEILEQRPKNKRHFSRLLDFYKEVAAICHSLGIVPVLSGSLAVFGYTKNPAMVVNDIDLACSELEFPRIVNALKASEVTYKLKEWHVLQLLKGDLKVEFDSMERWMKGLPDDHSTLVIDGYSFKVVSLSSLKELYKRGLEATTHQNDEAGRMKHLAIRGKYAALCAVEKE